MHPYLATILATTLLFAPLASADGDPPIQLDPYAGEGTSPNTTNASLHYAWDIPLLGQEEEGTMFVQGGCTFSAVIVCTVEGNDYLMWPGYTPDFLLYRVNPSWPAPSMKSQHGMRLDPSDSESPICTSARNEWDDGDWTMYHSCPYQETSPSGGACVGRKTYWSTREHPTPSQEQDLKQCGSARRPLTSVGDLRSPWT